MNTFIKFTNITSSAGDFPSKLVSIYAIESVQPYPSDTGKRTIVNLRDYNRYFITDEPYEEVEKRLLEKENILNEEQL